MQPTQIDPSEEWRPIPGFENTYLVSSLGRVWSRKRANSRGGLMKQWFNSTGYYFVGLHQNGQLLGKATHIWVALAFHGPRPADCPEIRHLDGNKLNNIPANLAYGTYSENNHDKRLHGTDFNANKSHCPSGHPYDESNTYVLPSRPSARYCRECSLAYHRRRRAAGGDLPHGAKKYNVQGCRCDYCRAANSEYKRQRREAARTKGAAA